MYLYAVGSITPRKRTKRSLEGCGAAKVIHGESPVCILLISGEETVKIAANLDEKDAKALKAHLEAELTSLCGGEWCVDVYRSRGRWLARAYRRGEHVRGPKPGTKYRPRRKQPHGASPASGTGGTNPRDAPK